MILINCSYCCNPYETKPYKALLERHYCSWECKINALWRPRTESCEYCGGPVTRRRSGFHRNGAKRIFCNKSCSTKWRFANPTANRLAAYGKNAIKRLGLYGNSCLICGFDRVIEFCHIIPAKLGGTIHPDNIIPLCPNHHTLMDKFLLTEEEDAVLDDYVIHAWGSQAAARFPDISDVPAGEPEPLGPPSQTD